MADRLVAEWAPRGGKRFVRLYHHAGGEDLGYGLRSIPGYYVESGNGGGNSGNVPDDATAIAVVERIWVASLRADFSSTQRIH